MDKLFVDLSIPEVTLDEISVEDESIFTVKFQLKSMMLMNIPVKYWRKLIMT